MNWWATHYDLTLIFAIPSLDLFMHPLLNFPLENPRSRGLVESGKLQDVSSVDPIIRPPSHDMVARNLEFVDWYL
jgi:hypothetical protein